MNKKDISKYFRINNKIISSTKEPVYIKSTSNITSPTFTTSSTSAAYASLTGYLFSLALDPLTLATPAGSSPGIIELNIANGSLNSKKLFINRIIYGLNFPTSSTKNVDFDLYYDGTFSTTGLTAKTPVNLNTGSSNTSITTAYCSDNTNTERLNGSSTLISTRRTTETTGQILVEYDGQLIITPGHSLTVKIVNSSTTSQSGAISLTITWWEI